MGTVEFSVAYYTIRYGYFVHEALICCYLLSNVENVQRNKTEWREGLGRAHTQQH